MARRSVEDLVEDLVRSARSRQDGLAEEMRQHQEKHDTLSALERSMSTCDSFDLEDAEAVHGEVRRHVEAQEELHREFERETQVEAAHRELFLCLRKTIAARQKLLDEEDGKTQVLETHPDLLAFLARKQLSLEELITSKIEDVTRKAQQTNRGGFLPSQGERESRKASET